jgi:septal ring factor EnvC (AmiA/AmiB activator)
MVHPVPCRIASGSEVCATRFSDRELRAMGFADVPMPFADECSTELGVLDAQISSLDRSLAESGEAIDSANETLASLVDQLKGIESQHPEQTMPPDVRAAYRRIANTYDALYWETSRVIAEYNATVQSRNAAAAKRADLPC